MDRSLKPTFGYLSDLGECGASHLGTETTDPKPTEADHDQSR